MSKKMKLIAIVGPTAVGKTALGIELAQLFNGEIISGDSQQVYKKLDIGTAKATAEEQNAVPHHLIDIRNVDEVYSVYDFVAEAKEAIIDINSRGKLPIIVGGTGLYLQSLLEGYHLGGEVNQDEVLTYRQEMADLSDEVLFEKIADRSLDIPQLNRRRAMRALELDKFGHNLKNSPTDYETLIIALNDDREVLYNRINNRVDSMVEKGLLEEAKWLYDNFPDVQATRGIGYKELFSYFAGEESLEQALGKLKQNTRRFAKRQLTWFRNRMQVTFYQVSEAGFKEKIKQDIQTFLKD